MNKAIPLVILSTFLFISVFGYFNSVSAQGEIFLFNSDYNELFRSFVCYNDTLYYFYVRDNVVRYKYADVNNLSTWSYELSTLAWTENKYRGYAVHLVGDKLLLLHIDGYDIKYKIHKFNADKTITQIASGILSTGTGYYSDLFISFTSGNNSLYFSTAGPGHPIKVYRIDLYNVTNIISIGDSSFGMEKGHVLGYHEGWGELVLAYWSSSSTVSSVKYNGSGWTGGPGISFTSGSETTLRFCGSTYIDGYLMMFLGGKYISGDFQGGYLLKLGESANFQVANTLSGYSGGFLISNGLNSELTYFYNTEPLNYLYLAFYNSSSDSYGNYIQLSVNPVNNSCSLLMSNGSYAHIYLKQGTFPQPVYLIYSNLTIRLYGNIAYANISVNCADSFQIANYTFYFETRSPVFATFNILIDASEDADVFSRFAINIISEYQVFDRLTFHLSVDYTYVAKLSFHLSVDYPYVAKMRIEFLVNYDRVSIYRFNFDVIKTPLIPTETEHFINTGVSILPLLFMLLIPTFLMYNYLGQSAVIPTFAGMATISFIAGLLNTIPFFICILVCVILMFYQFRRVEG